GGINAEIAEDAEIPRVKRPGQASRGQDNRASRSGCPTPQWHGDAVRRSGLVAANRRAAIETLAWLIDCLTDCGERWSPSPGLRAAARAPRSTRLARSAPAPGRRPRINPRRSGHRAGDVA